MIPACFSNPTTLSSTSQVPHQNLVTCIYQTQLCNSPAYLTLTWSKSLFSHSLTIYAADSFSITISLYPSSFSFFRNKPGSKSLYLTHHHYQRIKLYWDFTRAEFSHNSAEPESCFYIAISCDARLEFFLGDLYSELSRRSGLVVTRQLGHEPALLSRREHVFGRESYVSRANFSGSMHEIGIECSGGMLVVKVDGEISLVIKEAVEFFWDVFNWINNDSRSSLGGAANGHGVFIFQVGDGGVWPQMVGPEKRLMRKSMSMVGPVIDSAGAFSVIAFSVVL
ncbi:hypothetical protein OIU85_004922 [Salix viminalis]|uniref:Uncharacterized protein n=1 Tax=Salix viminalis TaxID=40686 RepID=A0A9Q0PUA8_SALVM|nr:hypothetical protein OIU85_004922 [Salix viminalis]